MQLIQLDNISGINASLQVGDLIYYTTTDKKDGASDRHAVSGGSNSQDIGKNQILGILRKIVTGLDAIELYVDDSAVNPSPPLIGENAFLMFSKYSQGDAGVLGYYSKVRLVNNSKEKAEIFPVSSEVIINSK